MQPISEMSAVGDFPLWGYSFLGYPLWGWISPAIDVGLDAAVKGTLLMLLAIAANYALRRSSAAVRHRVWGLMFCGLLLLPLLCFALPAWRVPLLPPLPPEHVGAETPTAVNVTSEQALFASSKPAAFESAGSLPLRPVDLLLDDAQGRPVDFPASIYTDAVAPSQAELIDAALVIAPGAGIQPATSQESPSRAWIGVALLMWIMGAALVLLPLVWGIGHNLLLWIRSARVEDAEWQSLLEELRDCIRLRRHVELLTSRRPLAPMTWGIVRPVILLPAQACHWTDRLRRFVLLHELAHVKRWDVGFQMLARLACAVYWFHPLVWYGMRRLRIERELACDDCVLMACERPSDYAHQLVEIARSCQSAGLVAAVAMAQGGTLEHRIRALLDRARSHLPLSRRLASLLLVASMTIVTGVAVVHPAAQEAKPSATQLDNSAPVPADAAETRNPVDEPAIRAPTQAAGTGVPAQADVAMVDVAMVAVRGQVVLPNGAPAAGAVVRAAAPMFSMLEPIVAKNFEPPLAQVTADAQGRFVISFSSQPFGDLSRFDQRWHDVWKGTTIAASLHGYGPQWVTYDKIEGRNEPITLKLVEDVPIEGRVVDLEGRPVASALVKVGSPITSEDDDLSAWIQGVKNGEAPGTLHRYTPRSVSPKLIGIENLVTTNDQGRFTIRGVGRERHVSLVIESETVARRRVSVATRPIDPIQRVISTPPFAAMETIYGAVFTFTAASSRPIVGTVRDANTGKPIPGVAVDSYRFAGYPYSNYRVLKTVTDEDGRYRLTGMPKGDGNRLLVLPNDDQPYFMQKVDVPNPVGLEAVTVDIEIHRGIWIAGRIADKATGEPVRGARVYYWPFRTNEFAQALPEFDDNGYVDGDQTRYQSKADGTYRLVGLPGRAVVGANSIYKQYRVGVGYDAIQGPYYRDTDYLDTYQNPVYPSPKWPNVMAEINPPEDAESVALDLQMDPGLSVSVQLVGPDDQPLTGVEVTGFTSSSGHMMQVKSDRFEMTEFAPNETRTILFHHQEKRLGCVARVSPHHAQNGPVTVKLQPVATLLGRLLDEDGTPMTGVEVEPSPLPSGDFAVRMPSVATDADGRFQLTLLSGAAYSLQARGASITVAEFLRLLTVEPGETKDLGNLRFVDRRFVPVAVGDTTPQRTSIINLRGHVYGPDGKPHQGARICLREPFATDWTPVGRTDGKGRFDASLDRTRLDAALAKDAGTQVRLAATAKGFGMARADVAASALEEEITLQLLLDVPIEGPGVDHEQNKPGNEE